MFSLMPLSMPSVDHVSVGGMAPGIVRKGTRARSTFARATAKVLGHRSLRPSAGAPTRTVMRSDSRTPFRSGLFSRSAASSLASTPSLNDRSHSLTSSSRCLAGGIGGGGPSRYSNTTGTFPAFAAALAAFSARVSTCVLTRMGDFAGRARVGDLKCRAAGWDVPGRRGEYAR